MKKLFFIIFVSGLVFSLYFPFRAQGGGLRPDPKFAFLVTPEKTGETVDVHIFWYKCEYAPEYKKHMRKIYKESYEKGKAKGEQYYYLNSDEQWDKNYNQPLLRNDECGTAMRFEIFGEPPEGMSAMSPTQLVVPVKNPTSYEALYTFDGRDPREAKENFQRVDFDSNGHSKIKFSSDTEDSITLNISVHEKKEPVIFEYITPPKVLTFSQGKLIQGFSDLQSAENPNYDAILYVQKEGIVKGYPDFTFKPKRFINRAEFTKIIITSVFDQNTIDQCTAPSFPDIPPNAWFAPSICVAKEKGIIQGYPDSTFRPTAQIKFTEAAKIIVIAFGYSVSSDSIWYKSFVEKLAEKQAIPWSITKFGQNLTRGEMAEIVYRLKAGITTKFSWSYKQLEKSSQ